MKIKIILLIVVLALATPLLGQTNVDPSAALEVDSTTKGFLPPRMTEVQRNAISSPAKGLLIFNTNTDRLNIYDGTVWTDLSKTAAEIDFTPAASLTATTTQAAIEELANRADRNIVFDARLNSATQNFNATETIYAWSPTTTVTDTVELQTGNEKVKFLKKGVFNVNTAIIVTAAGAADRSMAYVTIEHYNSSNVLVDRYSFSGGYVRNLSSVSSQGMSSGNITLVTEVNDYIQIKSIRVFSQSSSSSDPANQTQSILTIKQLTF